MSNKNELPQELKEFRALAGIERFNDFRLNEDDNSDYETEMEVGLDPNETAVGDEVPSPDPSTKGGKSNGPANALDVQKPKKQEGKGAPPQASARPAAPPAAKKPSTEDRGAVMAGARQRAAGRSR